MAGLVQVDGRPAAKPGMPVQSSAEVQVRERERFVSRGGIKLAKALQEFSVDVGGRIVLDVGASTGGFTDCLLQAGAVRVYSVDCGYGQLDWRLRQDERVVVMERTNVRFLTPRQIGEQVSLATADVSFISLTLVFPVLKSLAVPEVIALVKPQFEVGKGRVGKGGVVRAADDHLAVLERVVAAAVSEGYAVKGVTHSCLRGPEGNIEYFLYLGPEESARQEPKACLSAVVAAAHRAFAGEGPPSRGQ
jgi:23S rRNA (cytidine1920-2'-O)/16S rRNA (cytidine1409-2'-O)-methyltransferase